MDKRPLERFHAAMRGLLSREYGAQITLCEAVANLRRSIDELTAQIQRRDLLIRAHEARIHELERRLDAFTRQGGWVQ